MVNDSRNNRKFRRWRNQDKLHELQQYSGREGRSNERRLDVARSFTGPNRIKRLSDVSNDYDALAHSAVDHGNYREASRNWVKAGKVADEALKYWEQNVDKTNSNEWEEKADTSKEQLVSWSETVRERADAVRHGAALDKYEVIHRRKYRPTMVAIVGCFVLAALFATNSFTGYVIANATPQSPSQFGVIFFILGLAGAFVLLNGRRQ